MLYKIAEINQMSQTSFVATLGAVFEQTPAIAAQTWHRRPFHDVADLCHQMIDVMQALSPAEQLRLIQAHPDLGSRAKMADASVQEQAGVGLDRLTPDELAQLHSLNRRYVDRFGFPFIIAVKNHTKTTIVAALIERLEQTKAAEMPQALAEIAEIARFRLLKLVA